MLHFVGFVRFKFFFWWVAYHRLSFPYYFTAILRPLDYLSLTTSSTLISSLTSWSSIRDSHLMSSTITNQKTKPVSSPIKFSKGISTSWKQLPKKRRLNKTRRKDSLPWLQTIFWPSSNLIINIIFAGITLAGIYWIKISVTVSGICQFCCLRLSDAVMCRFSRDYTICILCIVYTV